MLKEVIYRQYINDDIDEYVMINKMDDIQDKTVKQSGVIYTPKHIVDFMITSVNVDLNMTIVEPSCGHGVFVFSLLDHVQLKFNLSPLELFQWFTTKVTCFDIALNTVIELKEMVQLYFQKRFKFVLDIHRLTNIQCEDSLFTEYKSYDLAIGNPPYVRTKNMDIDYLNKIRKTFDTCAKGNIDLYYAFIHKYLDCTQKMCFITPSSFITNISGRPLYANMMKHLSLLIDFQDKLVFKDARTYTCIFVLDKQVTTEFYLYAADIDQPLVDKKRHLVNDKKIRNSNILSGIATLADSTYLVKEKAGKFYGTYDNIDYEIEKTILAPYFKVTKIKNSVLVHDYLLCPYDRDNKIMNEERLKSEFPLAYKFLNVIRPKLDNRDKGKVDKYEAWYAYGRKQGLHTITNGDVTIIPLMIGNKCYPQKIDITSLLTEFGRVLFTSGFIVVDEDDKFMTEEFIQYAKNEGKPWPGKDQPYYAITARHVRQYALMKT